MTNQNILAIAIFQVFFSVSPLWANSDFFMDAAGRTSDKLSEKDPSCFMTRQFDTDEVQALSSCLFRPVNFKQINRRRGIMVGNNAFYIDKIEEDWVLVLSIENSSNQMTSYQLEKKMFPPGIRENTWVRLIDPVYQVIGVYLDKLKCQEDLQPVFMIIDDTLGEKAIFLRKKWADSDNKKDIVL